MKQIFTMALVCIALAVGTFLCAYIPQVIKASPKTLNLIAIFGSATIIGAAIIIILPESSALLINAQYTLNELNGVGVDHNEVVTEETAFTIGSAVMLGFAIMLIVNESFVIYQERAEDQHEADKIALAKKHSMNEDGNDKEPLIKREVEGEEDAIRELYMARTQQSGLLTTIALVCHSLTEGVAMGSALYCK